MFWLSLRPRTGKVFSILTASFLITGLIFSSMPALAFAQEAPSAPTAPSAPEPPPAPPAPEAPTAPSAPEAPTAPEPAPAPAAPEAPAAPVAPDSPIPSPTAGDDAETGETPELPATPTLGSGTQSVTAGGVTVTVGSGGSAVSTGNASASLSVNNSLNTNTASVSAGELDILVSNKNKGDLDNENGTEAETGNNSLSNTSGGSIDTGNAFASVSTINVVNTNIFDSQGLFLFLDNLSTKGAAGGDLDLRDFDFFKSPPAGSALNPAPLERLILTNSNTATITNALISRASSGGNLLQSRTDGSIDTGDAFAAANLINVVNTNIVGSNYLLLVFNNFGDWGSDVVFPNPEAFRALFPGVDFSGGSGTAVYNNDQAKVANNLEISASSGDNLAQGADSKIETGSTDAAVNVLNAVNTSIFNQDSLFVLFKVHGNWTGDVFGAPEGVSWTEENGVIKMILSNPSALSQSTSSPVEPLADQLTIRNNNKAVIENNIEVIALTGENRVDSVEEAVVKTGDAFAAANLINVVNTNVVGRNWLMAIINVFGDWSGNISFGRPDLWVGSRADFPDQPVGPGGRGTYSFTVTNRGDVPATGVKLFADLDWGLANLSQLSGGIKLPTGMVWEIGTIKPGQTKEISAEALISEHLPYGLTPIKLSARLSSRESDNNPADNQDQITFMAEHPAANQGSNISFADNSNPGSSPQSDNSQTSNSQTNINQNPNQDLALNRNQTNKPQEQSPNDKTVALPANIKISKSYHWQSSTTTVEYVIVITNFGGGPLYDAQMYDLLTNERDEIVNEELWNLDTIYPDEEITLTYTVIFKQSGIYTNAASVIGYVGETAGDRYEIESEIASTVIEIEVKEEGGIEDQGGQVSGAAGSIPGLIVEKALFKKALASTEPLKMEFASKSLAGIFVSGIDFNQSLALLTLIPLLVLYFERRQRSRG